MVLEFLVFSLSHFSFYLTLPFFSHANFSGDSTRDSKKSDKKKDLEKAPETVALKTADAQAPEEKKKKKSKTRKEKSVLQTKLTKLAIQIGYVGEQLDLA